MIVPAGGADDDVFAGSHTGLNIGDHSFGGGEIENHVDRGKCFGREGGGGDIFSGAKNLDLMAARTRYLGYQRSRFATAENQKINGKLRECSVRRENSANSLSESLSKH